MRLSKRRGRKATTVMITGKMTTKMDINHERVETFVMLADNMSRGEQNENVELRLPRKVLGAIASALRGAGY
jgi:hypothetical protein